MLLIQIFLYIKLVLYRESEKESVSKVKKKEAVNWKAVHMQRLVIDVINIRWIDVKYFKLIGVAAKVALILENKLIKKLLIKCTFHLA